tara:strand:+ start:1000 stop:1191 length:192 start_codon:yes stop_codon:yes gene_type:complete
MPVILAILYLSYHCDVGALKYVSTKDNSTKKPTVKNQQNNKMVTVKRIALVGSILKMERTKKN